jgi:hypothetical protein
MAKANVCTCALRPESDRQRSNVIRRYGPNANISTKHVRDL